MSTANIVEVFSVDTEYSADSVEWCPISPFHNLLSVGTYQIQEHKETLSSKNDHPVETVRKGKIFLYEFNLNEEKLNLLEKTDVSAILDMKWCPHIYEDKVLLAVANASSELCIYYLHNSTLKIYTKIKLENNCLVLSLDWSTGKIFSSNLRIVTSDSFGVITVFALSGNSLVLLKSWKGHNFEAWISAFNYWNTDVVFTGGDDCCFKGFDLRTNEQIFLSRAHEMGVTSIHKNKFHEFSLVSGSYDENVNLWDTRSMKRPITSQSLGGGVWRLKWDPFYGGLLLGACMHNGFHILNMGDDNVEKKASNMNHESLAYGGDWCHIQIEKKMWLASCSFYDHKLSIWYLN